MASLVLFAAVLVFAFAGPLFWRYGYAQFTPGRISEPVLAAPVRHYLRAARTRFP